MRAGTVEEAAMDLIKVAVLVGPEDEGLDLTDQDFELEDLVALKNHLSTMRHAIDVVNAALAQYWKETYGSTRYKSQHDSYGLSRTKGKKAIDKTLFYEWLATKTATELSKLVADYNIKVGGMTGTERTTLLDESPSNDRYSITARPLIGRGSTDE